MDPKRSLHINFCSRYSYCKTSNERTVFDKRTHHATSHHTITFRVMTPSRCVYSPYHVASHHPMPILWRCVTKCEEKNRSQQNDTL